MTEAVAQLQKGLDLLRNLPDDNWRGEQEIDLLLALGRAQIAAKGYAARGVGDAFARARALAEQLDRSDCLVPLLWGQCAFQVVRSELRPALSLAERIEQIGEAQDDVAVRLLGRLEQGEVRYWLGEFVAARTLFEQCDGLNVPAHRSVYAGLTTTDQYEEMLTYLAWTLACLGYVDQACRRMNEAFTEARQCGHAHSLAWALRSGAWIELEIGSVHEAQRHAEELVGLAHEHGFPLWLGWGHLCRGSSLTAQGLGQEGLPWITNGLSMYGATGGVVAAPWMLTTFAETYARVGQLSEGLSCLARQMIERTEAQYAEADVYRLRGDILNVTGDRAAAEQSYHQALAVAERQSAKLFELRAATNLARLWRDQGRGDDAHALLAPIYGWFTEGFDTPVLQDAKVLLDQLV
jgi:predicted ATPase